MKKRRSTIKSCILIITITLIISFANYFSNSSYIVRLLSTIDNTQSVRINVKGKKGNLSF